MGLDIYFESANNSNLEDKTEVGYFRKVNFLLTYFGIKEEDNCKDFNITKEQFNKFLEDLKTEYNKHEYPYEGKPENKLFYCKDVFFGGAVGYNEWYWNDFEDVYGWADGLSKDFDWDNNSLFFHAWW